MKFIIKFSFAVAAVTAFIFSACNRKSADFIGPAYIAAPEGFAVTSFTATQPSIDFTSASPELLNATFTSSVTWILTITGNESGAVHTASGISNGFTNLPWLGDSDGALFFRSGEAVTATLSFFGTEYKANTNINIVTAPDYTTCGTYATSGDFEIDSMIQHKYGWHAFNDPTPIADVVQGVGYKEVDYNGDTVRAAQGHQYYFIRGLGNQSVFVSGIQYTGALMPLLPTNADEVWVNILLYGTGDENAGVELEYQENDPGRGAPGYQGETDDAFVARITLNHKGWKMFSFRYSDLTPSLNLAFGGSGNKIHEPNRLVSFDLVLVKKTDPNKAIEVYFDYPIITVGGPFKPCH